MTQENIESRPTVLVVDDDESVRVFLQYHLEKAGFKTVIGRNGREALELVSEAINVALLDLSMPDPNGITCLRQIRKSHPEIETIIVTASSEIGDAVEAMRSGAFDYVTKPVNIDELVETLQRAARTAQLTKENRQLRQAMSLPWSEVPFIGASGTTERVLDAVDKLAHLDSTVLISGESGVGKGLVARMIHNAGPRAVRPFITVSCTALPRELVEAELFGHEKGAFTGAHERRPGRLEMADGGSLFLDEVGDMPLDSQPKLLTFLQDRAFQRIGSNKTISVRVRIIAASNQNLKLMCQERRFREDLYFRLNVLPLHIPPLRERHEDILPIAEYLLGRIAQRRNIRPFELSEEARRALVRYQWPGNVRELDNVLQRTTAFSAGPTIAPDDLPAEIHEHGFHAEALSPVTLADVPLREVEKMAILQTLESCRGNRAEAARRLGISKKGIYIKMKRLGLSPAM
ncbi:MAG: sigma-54-dependent Fis family transcriptional regulator [Acidobacteria bacterium]|nr:sigma-54-dependent Fis family transcriptional regulator [Acidobacteriota bacterium]